MRILILLTFFISFIQVGFVRTLEPFSIAALGGLIASGYKLLSCSFTECCTDKFVVANISGLEFDLKRQLHGQHLVSNTVVNSIKGHFDNTNPHKALVLSLHGCTGCGKNFVSRIIANNLYKNGMKSSFVHLFIATHHFPHEDEVGKYKDNLRNWIQGNVSLCDRSLFVFDEMDKMHQHLIDVIKPFIDHNLEIDGVDYRKSTFIFLSNNGADAIAEKTLEHWKRGLARDQLQLRDMERLLTIRAFNEKGGLWHSSLIEKNLISAFIPFLPMEREHVKRCIYDDILSKGHPVLEDTVNQVADSLLYFPEELQLFTTSGCKRVSQKVDLALYSST